MSCLPILLSMWLPTHYGAEQGLFVLHVQEAGVRGHMPRISAVAVVADVAKPAHVELLGMA